MVSNIGFNNIYFKGSGYKTETPQPSRKITEKDGFVITEDTFDSGIKSVSVEKLTTAQKNVIKRIELLSTPNDEGKVVLRDKNGTETVLPRALTPSETDCSRRMNFFNKNEKIKSFIEIKDFGISELDAASIASGTDSKKRFYALITPDEKGCCTLCGTDNEKRVLSRPLSPKEAAVVVLAKNKKVSDSKLQTFIDLIDNYGLDIQSAHNIAHKQSATDKFYALTTPNKKGKVTISDKEGETIELSRPFTTDEAIIALDLDNSKLQTFQMLCDKNLDIKDALWLSKDDRRSSKFLALTTPDENGRATISLKDETKLVLPRALAPSEALIAMREFFTNDKIHHQLTTEGYVHSTRRDYSRRLES